MSQEGDELDNIYVFYANIERAHEAITLDFMSRGAYHHTRLGLAVGHDRGKV